MLAPPTPKPCKRGHVGVGRYKNGACKACQRLTSVAYYWKDPERSRQVSRDHFGKNPQQALLNGARERAKAAGYPCTITTKDIIIPEFCPLLNIKLKHSRGSGPGPKSSSPSLDKIKPELGYVPGNVWVISHRANLIKSNATLEELQTLTTNLTRIVRTYPWECV